MPGTEAHRLIERLMILTNERVAEFLVDRRVPAVYRVHAQPDPPRIEHLLEQLAALGVPTPPLGQGLSPRSAGEMAAARQSAGPAGRPRRRGHGAGRIYLPCAQVAETGSIQRQNSGHAGLGSDAYLHFTSPIRRYPDLLVHRALLAALGEGEEAPTSPRRARSPPTAPPRSESRRRSSAMPTTSAPHTCWNGSSAGAGSTSNSRGRSRA